MDTDQRSLGVLSFLAKPGNSPALFFGLATLYPQYAQPSLLYLQVLSNACIAAMLAVTITLSGQGRPQ